MGEAGVESAARSESTSSEKQSMSGQDKTRSIADHEPAPPPQPAAPAAAMPPPPNGGLVAWLHVLGGFMLFFNTWGVMTSFGVFQTYYESGELFERTSSDISWIGSLQAFLVQFGGIAAGPIYDLGYLRALLCVGSFCIVFGHMMLSLATTYWQALLAQGLCVGVGMGCLFVPCVSILPTYFSTRLGLAVGVASAGSSLGGVIYPIVLQRLLGSIGFAWAVRVIGFIALVTLAVPLAVMRMRIKPAKARAIIDWTAFTDLPYMWFTIATLLGFMGLGPFQFYFSFYAEHQKLTSTELAFNLVTIYNAVSTFGRIIPNAISDKIGPLNVLAPSICVMGVVYFCTMATHSGAGIIVLTAAAGIFLGIFTGMVPVCFAALVKDKSRLGTRIGMGFAMTSFGLLIGGPGGGAVLGSVEPLNWVGVWVFAGTSASVAGIMYVVLRFARTGFKLGVKA